MRPLSVSLRIRGDGYLTMSPAPPIMVIACPNVRELVSTGTLQRSAPMVPEGDLSPSKAMP